MSSYRAVVLGSTGGIGAAFVKLLEADPECREVVGLSRATGFDLTDENAIFSTAQDIAEAGPVDIIIDATGFLHDQQQQPEKSIRALNAVEMARSFALNATGPLLALKHFHTLLPVHTPGIFATLSARVGSIEDNRLGGWYGYRMSKAALNMGLKTAAIEIARKRKQAACVAIHPGTVATPLSDPFAGSRKTFTPEEAAEKMLKTLGQLGTDANGTFLDYNGVTIPW